MWDLIVDQLVIFTGWRFYLAYVPTVLVALLFHFVVGWTDATRAITVVLVLISSCCGIGRQLNSEGRFTR